MGIRVLLVDDHAGVRSFIRSLLKKANDIEVVGEAQDGKQALLLTQQLNPDVMLLDIEMPGMTGIEVARNLRERQARVVVLAVSSYNDRHLIVRMLESGAAGYLVKDEVPNHLLTAIRDVAGGKRGWMVESHRRYIESYHQQSYQ
jgi:two-component system NarL family response regulator